MMLLAIIALNLASQVYSRGLFDTQLHFYDPDLTDSIDWRLLQELAPRYKNVIVSPISIKLILGLLYQGSDSENEKEFQRILNYGNKEVVKEKYTDVLNNLQNTGRTEYLLNIGTAIFLDKNLRIHPNFEKISRRHFRTDIRPTNFNKPKEASDVINEWIEHLTNGKMKKIIDASEVLQTLMIITNAIYFKGTWTHQFPKNQTRIGTFFTTPNVKHGVPVEYMTTVDEFYFYEYTTLNCKVLRLEYKDSSFAMFILLPNTIGGLDNLIKNIDLSKIGNMRFQMTQESVRVTIPKFKFNFDVKLAPILQKFGLHQLFENTTSLTGIIENNSTVPRRLFVNNIVQKSGIEVDEEGSVIYSATEFNVVNKFAENILTFNASHPFMFFIEGPNNTILFVGKCEDPSTSGDSADSQILDANQLQLHQPQFVQVADKYNSDETLINTPSLNLDPDVYQSSDVDIGQLTSRFNLFDIELLGEFKYSPVNVLISPASVKTTLSMILEGAVGNCAVEISEALRIPDINSKAIRMILQELLNNLNEKATANTYLECRSAVFFSDKQRLLDDYRNAVMKFYNAYLKPLDFTNATHSAKVINKWVSDSTRGAIDQIISEEMINPESYIVISNALYFKGRWKNAFDKKSTTKKCFYTNEGGCVEVQMMHISDSFHYNYISALRAYVVDIPYEDIFSMLVILPSANANVRTVIRDLPHFMSTILDNLNRSEIVLELPRFSFEYSVDLMEHLKSLNVRDIFGKKANLSKIVEGKDAKVNSLLHKTKIEVDEDGTTAAASTSAMIIPLMQPVTITADRPFLFMIYHRNTKNIIFEGIVQNPLNQDKNNKFKRSSTNRNRRG